MAEYKMCERCKCCSVDPRDGSCVGGCEPCGHHAGCPRCEERERARVSLEDIAQNFLDDVRDWQRKWG